MALSQTILLNSNSNSDHEQTWHSKDTVAIPTQDILSFAFANCEQYDQDKPIFVDAYDASNYISARVAKQKVRELITGFKRVGLQEGDTVCLHAYNNIWYPLLWLGVIGAGGCVTGTNPAYTSSELTHHFRITKTKFVIAQIGCCEALREAALTCKIPPSNIFLLDEIENQEEVEYQSWATLLGQNDDVKYVTSASHHDLKSRTAVYGSTSGTTGLPKAAVHTHGSIVAQSVMVEFHLREKNYKPSQLVYLPIFHAFAAQFGILYPLRLGITTYFLPRFNIEDFLQVVSTFSITDTSVVPPIVTALLNLSSAQHDHLQSLRYIVCAGAPMTASIQTSLYRSLSPKAVIAQCWGTTEVGWISAFGRHEKDVSGSVGRLLPNVELKIIDDNGQLVTEEGRCGEACIHSPSRLMSYSNNSEATAVAFDKDGFYKTGDRIYVKDNKIFIDGRIKDIIKVNGWQVSPAEIENVLLLHPKIADVAVVGISRVNPDGIKETLPRAYVVRAGRCTTSNHTNQRPTTHSNPNLNPIDEQQVPLTADEVRIFVESKLISYKRLSGGVIFVNKIPRSGTGKILRLLLSTTSSD